MLYSSMNTNLNLVWMIPRNCHTYLLDTVLAPPGIIFPRVTLLSRFLNFFRGLLDSPSPEVQMLARLGARDIRSNLGTNLIHVREEMGLEPWCYGGKRVTDELREHNRARVPEVDEWRVPLLHKLLAERQACFYLGYDDLDTYNELTHSLVTN